MADHKRWLETLLDRMLAPADLMREHLGKNHHNPTLGAAAEAGVRTLLRAVLPARIGVTSGFVRAEIDDAEPSAGDAISPQTDVVLYDASRVVPLHGIGGVDVFAARDVLGVIEVKDTEDGSDELAYTDKAQRKGALRHIGRIGRCAPRAFRAVVLLRGKPGRPRAEVDRAVRCFEVIRADNLRTEADGGEELLFPHLVYCASYKVDDVAASYVAFEDARTRTFSFREWLLDDRVFALSCFLRVVTGFFAAQRLISPSLHLDLTPTRSAANSRDVTLGREHGPQIASLCEELRRPPGNEVAAPRARLADLFVEFLKGHQESRRQVNLRHALATFHDERGFPTAGFRLMVSIGPAPSPAPGAGREGLPMTELEAHFRLSESGDFVCAETNERDDDRWQVDTSSFEDYVRQARQQSGLGAGFGGSYGGPPGIEARRLRVHDEGVGTEGLNASLVADVTTGVEPTPSAGHEG